MKYRRVLALSVAVALVLGLMVLPASAVTFGDLTGHWSKSDVENLANRGIINGYSDGTFKPDGKMSAAEALIFCARVTRLEASLKNQIAAAHGDELRSVLPEAMRSWAVPEIGICLETGILSWDELSALCTSGAISQAISREKLSKYLVRAIQMAAMAENLSTYSLSFSDTSQIDESLQPYVYLLYTYGIMSGNQHNEFMPKSNVSRAEMATLLKRALDFMDTRGVEVELPQYTSYDWFGGTILSASAGSQGGSLLTLASDFSGTRVISLPANVPIYDNNMRSTTAALRVGSYARVNLSRAGTPDAVRVSGSLTTVSGQVANLAEGLITVSPEEGGEQRFVIDRFTQVQVGGKAGTSSLIDLSAGYSGATCRVDGLGHLASVSLTGGTRQETGILQAVDSTVGGTVIQVSAFNGENRRYTLSAEASVFIDGLLGSLTSNHTGCYLTLRVSNDEVGKVSTLYLDTHTDYVQGSIRNVRTSTTPHTVTVNHLSDNRTMTYEVAAGAQIRYNGESTSLSKIQNGWFVTLLLTNGDITSLDAYPGSSTVYGTITAIRYGTTTAIDIKRTDQTVGTYNIDLTKPPVIYRGDTRSSIDRLMTGDEVELTIRYNQVERIDAIPQDANVTGIITRITMEAAGITLDLTLSDGSTASYQVANGIPVTKDGKALALSSLKPQDRVSLVVNNNHVVSIEVEKTSGNGTQLNGTVLYVNTSDRTILLQWEGSDGAANVTTVQTSSANLMRIDGTSVTLSWIKPEDVIQVYGNYEGNGFRATLIIVLSS
ncbi:MAG: S-layer homology domain-containing protein [Oscillospiraceae bacterium]|nr:S-layer homology domain-containing protein [Oscillospiraceae bacterium]